MEILLLIFAYFYFFKRKPKKGEKNEFNFTDLVFKTTYKIFNKFFHFIIRSSRNKSNANKQKYSSSNKKHESSGSSRNPETNRDKEMNISLNNHCLAKDFHKKLENPVQQMCWLYFIDNYADRKLAEYILIDLDKNATEPMNETLPTGHAHLNLPSVWRVIEKTYNSLQAQGLTKFYMDFYKDQLSYQDTVH